MLSSTEILWKAFSSSSGHILLWAAGVLGAVLTAFYMTRLMALTFWGKSRVDKNIHPHESPWLMTVPLIVLAILSVVGGWVGIPHVISEQIGHIPNFWEHWLQPVIRQLPAAVEGAHHDEAALEWSLMATSVGLAALSALAAYIMYTKKEGASDKVANIFGPLYQLVNKKYLVDEAYSAGIINPLIKGSKNLWYYVDVNFIDKATYKVSDLVRGSGSFVKSLQTGNMQQYAMYIGLGVVVALSFVLMR